MKIFTILLLIMLTGCSRLSIGLKFADTLAISTLGDYFDLDSKQKKAAREEFNVALKEVRRNEFPRIAEMLDRMADEVEQETFTEARLTHWIATIKSIFADVLTRFEPLLQRVITEQFSKGFARFDKEFNEKQEERAKKLKTEKDRLKVVEKRVKPIIDETLGDLNREQQSWLETLLKESPLVLEQESRQAVFENFKVARTKPETRIPFVRNFLKDWEGAQTPSYRSARTAYQTKSFGVIIRILQNADADQRQSLIKNFRSRAKELRTLSVVD